MRLNGKKLESFHELNARLERERRERITPPGPGIRKDPEPGATCLECALGVPIYIPCGKPAEFVIENRSEVVPMCAMCADHNVRNRGANYMKADKQS